MKNYLKLVNFEFNRFSKMYMSLIIITIFSELIGAYVFANKYMKNAQTTMVEQSLTKSEYVFHYEKFSFFNFTQSAWVAGPIALCIVTLFLYIFLIWYRDWFGKNTFVYRLLTLPTNRLNIYLAKATTIFIMTLGLTALQIILLPIINQIFQWVIPSELIESLSIFNMLHDFNYLMILFPMNFVDFSIHYSFGLLAVLVLFTAILLERCFKIRGIILGIIYCLFSLAVLFSPFMVTSFYGKFILYPMEYFILEGILSLCLAACSIGLSGYLLKNKITV